LKTWSKASDMPWVLDFDPAQLPCQLLPFYWYSLLARLRDAA
jgi:hypothetical protein